MPDDTYDRMRERILAVPVSDRIGSRRLRRRRVMALYGGYALYGAACLMPGEPLALHVARAAVALAGLAGTGYGVATLLRRTYVNAPQISGEALDERQRSLRDNANAIATPLCGLAVALCAAFATCVWTFAPNEPRLWSAVVYAIWGATIVVSTLPTALIAWREPDPIAET